ncbi:MAG: DUF1232 domain-containing protein [Bacteroidetes bacterium]|nr:DUF1232 domain-containing protein [Bacteroidota bacterium]
MSTNEHFENMKSTVSEQDIQKINNNLGPMQRGPVADIWDKVMALWRMIQDPNAPWGGKALAIAALLYLISPIDAVPDFIPFAGLMDDVGIILWTFAQLALDLDKYTKCR